MTSNSISLPGSKSIAARALILKRVFGTDIPLVNLPGCDDTRELAAALDIYDNYNGSPVSINIGNGGTSLRFFLALAASTPGFEATIDCGEQLRCRPVDPLVSALKCAGADITYVNDDMRAPLLVRGRKLNGTGLHVDTDISSQFASALILVSPLWESPYILPEPHDIASDTTPDKGNSLPLASRPYIEMSVKMTHRFAEFARLRSSAPYIIEPDWSAAAFFYEYAQLHPDTQITFERLVFPGNSLQGDSTAAFLFGLLGVDTVYNPDGSATIKGCRPIIERMAQSVMPMQFAMHSTPDLVPPMAVALCLSGIRFTMTGVRNLRFKESDRLDALSSELRKLGFCVELSGDTISWTGSVCPATAPQSGLDSHGDHRMAMALAATGIPADNIEGYSCVSKSFPDFHIPF